MIIRFKGFVIFGWVFGRKKNIENAPTYFDDKDIQRIKKIIPKDKLNNKIENLKMLIKNYEYKPNKDLIQVDHVIKMIDETFENEVLL